MKAWMRGVWIIGLSVLLLIACQPEREEVPDIPDETVDEGKTSVEKQWVVKWKMDQPDPRFLESVHVLHRSQENGGFTMLVKLKQGVKEEDWLKRWAAHEQIEFIHPNQKYEVEQREGAAQRGEDRYYLRQIGADQAWRELDWPVQSHVTVAVVDTGVDFNHPLLEPYLISGINLRDPVQPAQDYMGHGTHVAGVMVEVWDGWERDANAAAIDIMPVKVMNDGKDGDVYFTAEGMREAVRRGADVIVLAQGSWTYSETMADAVRFAEEEGVLVVGATGNASLDENGDIRYNSPVHYPAAFPEVLGVGAVGREGKVVPTSNGGSGIDVVAPGESIVAAVPGGGRKADSGTSFAAPQAAALAALLKGQTPTLTPEAMRNRIRQSARPVGEERWDEWGGYGEIDVLSTLTQKGKADIFEPNDSPQTAMPLSRDQRVSAVLAGKDDTDCFQITTPYEGTLTLKVEGEPQGMGAVTLRGTAPGEESVEYSGEELEEVHLSVEKHEWIFCLSTRDDQEWAYTLSNQFRLQPDAYENNDQRWSAYRVKVEPGISSFQGTFHKERDDDWFRFDLDEPGSLRLSVNVWSPRGDPVLYLQEAGSWKGTKVDEAAEGVAEEIEIDVKAGSLFVRVSDYGRNAIPDPYLLLLEFQPEARDAYEPNDTSRQATPLPNEEAIRGQIAGEADVDWFTFVLEESQSVRFRFTLEKEPSRPLTVVLFDENLRTQQTVALHAKKMEDDIGDSLQPGRYFIRLSGEGEEEWEYRFRKRE
ncbi:S8 family peptidase [Desmospora activa]|uniref:Subtilase family protein n=1 Tax=Desmospora activa DSM 45169 TaxID=1121389 RepID=A0A2T4Z4A3_9BACL|nr:S8 family serine peptidase [Desmospora activa]PTM56706.1 subtilase family protein [Desmospora activa DSM 45169]